MTERPTIYLKAVLSTDPFAGLTHRDVVARHERDGPEILRWVWHDERKPKRGRKSLVLCRIRHQVEWI